MVYAGEEGAKAYFESCRETGNYHLLPHWDKDYKPGRIGYFNSIWMGNSKKKVMVRETIRKETKGNRIKFTVVAKDVRKLK